MSATEHFTGHVQRLTFYNPDNGYFVAKVVDGRKREHVVTGYAVSINVGEQLTAVGRWEHSQWGLQFKVTNLSLAPPTMVEGIEKYLCGVVSGVGPGFAKKLVTEFGAELFDVIENQPERLAGVKGIGPKRAAALITAYNEHRATREIMVYLHQLGLSSSKASKVHRQLGDDAVAQLKENPYLLCREIWGIGFSTADEAAQRQGIPLDSEYRARAGVQHVMNAATGNGSCGLPQSELLAQACTLLNQPQDLVERAIELELLDQRLIRAQSRGVDCLFSPAAYSAEQTIARLVLDRLARPPSRGIKDIDAALQAAQSELGIELSSTQTEAARVVLASNVAVLTGGPGTGKTTMTKVVLRALEASTIPHTVIVLAAPTGKAAKRASEATGRPSSTFHRLLQTSPAGGFKHNEKNPLSGGQFTADEFSMADVFITASYLRAVPASARVLIIGDVDQLDSVGPGRVLFDLISSGVVPVARLTEVRRQAAGSAIISNAHRVNKGELPVISNTLESDFHFYRVDPRDEAEPKAKIAARAAARQLMLDKMMVLVDRLIARGYDPIRDIQLLSPMRKGLLGVANLNQVMQAKLNPHPPAALERAGVRWGVGDKVMQLKNNYDKDVFNGDVGIIVDASAQRVVVEMDDKLVEYKPTELDELTLAFASSIHRSQGSEYPVVIMPVDTSHYMLLKRRLFYTGITRAKKLFVGVGSFVALRKAVGRLTKEEAKDNDLPESAAVDAEDPRYTMLYDFLRAGSGKLKELRKADEAVLT